MKSSEYDKGYDKGYDDCSVEVADLKRKLDETGQCEKCHDAPANYCVNCEREVMERAMDEELAAVKQELAEEKQNVLNEQADITMLCEIASRVYYHITDGAISKPNTCAEDIIAVADDCVTKTVENEVEDATEELRQLLRDCGQAMEPFREFKKAIDFERSLQVEVFEHKNDNYSDSEKICKMPNSKPKIVVGDFNRIAALADRIDKMLGEK